MTTIDIQAKPGLYRATSESTTVYCVDSMVWPPRVLRDCHRDVITVTTQFDGGWVSLVGLVCQPIILTDWGTEIDVGDPEQWVLATGARHIFIMEADDIDLGRRQIVGRECTGLTLIEQMPDGLPPAPSQVSTT